MKVNNYDFCSDSFYSSQAGFLNAVGDDGEYASEAAEILGMEYDESEPEAWADIMFSRSTGKQYAVCGTAMVTASGADFYYKELEESQYIECSAKYLDEFGPKTDENLEYLEDDDVVVEEDHILYKGNDPIIFDDGNVTHCEKLFEGFYTASSDVNIAAYLIGCRHKYCLQDTVYYWR